MSAGAKLSADTRRERIVFICDWLPPDYGAVGQYSLLFARELAAAGADVVLGGLSSTADSDVVADLGTGRLREIRIGTAVYEKTANLKRLWWTARTNTRILWRLRHHLLAADRIVFTGSPPFLLHWLAPLNLLLRKTLVYRITDFHPECLIAQTGQAGPGLRLFYKLTLFWRRRVDEFEVLGEDQRVRLAEIGITGARVRLKRDPSPVEITADTRPLARPAEGRLLLLYSGNWGVAHDTATFVEGYRRHHRDGSGRFVLWLNAVGGAVETIETAMQQEGLPYIRGKPVPLADLASLLVTPDAHLITLLDPFVGFVLPSKVYGCVASGLPVLFVGSERSDVHALCTKALGARYRRVNVGDPAACLAALEALARSIDGAGHAAAIPMSDDTAESAAGVGSIQKSHYKGSMS